MPKPKTADVLPEWKHWKREIQTSGEDISTILDSDDVFVIREFKRELQNLGQNLERCYRELVKSNESLGDSEYEVYVELKRKIREMTSSVSKAEDGLGGSREESYRRSSSGECTLKLPTFELPEFKGEFGSWLNFKDIFEGSIGNNPNLSDVQKFQYLKSALKGEAARLVSGFAITNANYSQAWESLRSRYDNKRELAYAHCAKIFQLKPVKIANSKCILELLDTANEAIRGLECLGLEVSGLSNVLLVYFLKQKLDENLIRQWELSQTREFPKYDEFIAFLEKQASCMKSVHDGPRPREESKINSKLAFSCATTKQSSALCLGCNQDHKLSDCQKFKSMTFKERWTFVKSKNLCFNCLRKNHSVAKCLFTTRCQCCKGKHHTLLHEFKVQPPIATPTSEETPSSSAFNVSDAKSSQVLLSTAIINVRGCRGNYVKCRALLDSGSQSSLITADCCKKIGLIFNKSKHSILGVSDEICDISTAQVNLKFSAHFCKGQIHATRALVVEKLSSKIPNFEISVPEATFSDIQLADPKFYESRPIDIILGADVFFEIMEPERLAKPDSPLAVKTKLGWILTGKVPAKRKQGLEVSCIQTLCYSASVEEILNRFWELEAIPAEREELSDEMMCEEIYSADVNRSDSGRYIVSLPFKSTTAELGESRSTAVKRFKMLERRLSNQPELKKKYVDFMNEYQELGHMELIPQSSVNTPCTEHFYMPHHGVLREQSSTTKLRVVFDASCKTSSGISLNQILHSGPRLQEDIFDVLLRFRSHAVALTADIEKMFRQILVRRDHSEFQRIVWRNDPSEELKDYRLTTVTYGTSCAPFLAIRTIQQLIQDEERQFPEVSRIASKDFYVDDLLTGAATIDEARNMMNQIITLLRRGGFQLRKWNSNIKEVTEDLPPELKGSSNLVQFEKTPFTKVLGILWNPCLDTFSVQVDATSTEILTKRQLLSHIAKVYDPLGFLSPTTVILKIVMQGLWKDHKGWDEPLNDSHLIEWNKICKEFPQLNDISVPRFFVNCTRTVRGIDIHGFCDASCRAYSAVCYLRTEFVDGAVNSELICAKTKVAPLKSTTIPRLELCGAILLSKLSKRVHDALNLKINNIILWTDSKVVLHWIKSDHTRWKTFVANRVKQIQELSDPKQWHHVSGKENPADCASRGLTPSQLRENSMWWKGPDWLSASSLMIPSDSDLPEQLLEDESELKKSVYANQSLEVVEESSLINRYSSFVKLKRITGWCLRFINNCKSQNKTDGPLSAAELNSATVALVRTVQNSMFKEELNLLKKGNPLPPTNKFLSLNPFIDSNGLLRVGGRLKHSILSSGAKHPLLLPKNHHLTELIVEHYHLKYLHAGAELVLSMIRQEFWITSGRSTVRKILKKCVTCYRFKAQPESSLLGSLPAHRVLPCRPFQRTGVDFAGPITTKPILKRSKVRLKSYLALFVCFTTKAIHIEIVSELTTSAFLAAFRRFISRRGKPTDMYSDNATNFKGTANYLRQQFELCKSEDVQKVISEEKINWHFIPPVSPHFGGLWESNIKCLKRHLMKTCKESVLTFEELTTLTVQIEACMNSRPLTQLSQDPNELQALTPGHFLIGTPMTTVLEGDDETSGSLQSKWAKIQKMRRDFWKRWSKEYLTSLQPRMKWKRETSNLAIGDLVILKEDTPPLKWHLARVTQIFPGDDGTVRVVEVKTVNGVYRRSVIHLCRLPIEH